MQDKPIPRAYQFNRDPDWHAFIQEYELIIERIAIKFCTGDEDLREDVKQEARIGLLAVSPTQIDGYDAYMAGELAIAEWTKRVDRYCRNVIRNSILSYLDSYSKGNWYIGRTRTVKDRKTGDSKKVYHSPRFSSLDQLVDDFRMQVDTDGTVTWPDVADDGLVRRTMEEE